MRYGTVEAREGSRTFRQVSILLLAVAGLLGFVAIAASSAKAEEVGYELDRGVINLGGEEEGLWAKLIDPELSPPDAPATIAADVAADGTLTAEQGDFFFPPKRIEDLATGDALLPFIDANVAIAADGPITGSFDLGTGETDVSIPADVLMTIFSAGSPAFVAKCRIDGFNLEFSTEPENMSDPGDPAAEPPRPAAEYDSAHFASPGFTGAMIAKWATLPASDAEAGSLAGIVCPAMDGLLSGPGGVWLAGKAGTDIDPPVQQAPKVAPKITGTPATSTDKTDADFTFTQGEGETSAVTGFMCKLDGGAFEACDAGTKKYSGLAVGAHSFEVKAINPQGEGPVSKYDWTITSGTGPGGEAKLGALSVSPKNRAVKRGKKTTFTVKIRNTGDAEAAGVKVCLRAPKRLVGGAKCIGQGTLAAGGTTTKKFKVTIKKKARKGKRITLAFKATSNNAGVKSAKASVKVK
ncbi:MAG TPA: CARDB domain-containing protein [Solirubrobacterales bacterium]|nr:CARDB domain-containing protein [Solirubrobacterales bacterium]